MSHPLWRHFVLAWLAVATALGPAVPQVLGTSKEPIIPDQSCARSEKKYQDGQKIYAADPGKYMQSPSTEGSPRFTSTLMVVPGDAHVPAEGELQDLRTTAEVTMGDPMRVCVMGLHDWIYVKNNNPTSLRLTIAGHTLSLRPSVGPSEQEYLTFVLHFDPEDTEDWKAWTAILDAARHSNKKMVAITVTDTKEFFESRAYAKVVTIPKGWRWIAPLLGLLIALLVYLAATTGLLRNSAPPDAAEHSPFSLGLVQMAFWFCLSLAAYIYICLATLQMHVPMGSVLGLLGISSTTGLAAVFVDKQKSSATTKLAAEAKALEARLSSPASAAVAPCSPADDALLGKQIRLAQVHSQLAQSPAATGAATSQGFVNDILNDGEGISFHRFQIAMWTVVLGTVFVWSVYRNLTMPEFDASLLTLMGVSSGTYVGFKFSEKAKTGEGSADGAPGATSAGTTP